MSRGSDMKESVFCQSIATVVLIVNASGANVQVDAGLRLSPESIQIFTGDTVTWKANDQVQIESYTDEWKSPILKPSETYSVTFTKSGRYIYGGTSYVRTPPEVLGRSVASVSVMPLETARPPVWILSPPEGFFAYKSVLVQAGVTNTDTSVVAVNFYRDNEFVSTVTNGFFQAAIPGSSGVHQVRAELVDTTGRTNAGAAATFTFLEPTVTAHAFDPVYLPNVGIAFNYATVNGRPPLLYSSSDLETWVPLDKGIAGQALILNFEPNLARHFLQVRPGPF
jgi:plastocyanin